MMQLDGAPVTLEQAAAVAMLNYGHFSTMRVDGDRRVKGLDRHLQRLRAQSRLLFDRALDPDRVRGYLRRVADAGTGPVPLPLMLKATVFDPAPDGDRELSVLVTTRPPSPRPGTDPEGVRLRTVDYARELPAVKHLGFFGPVHQRRRAQQAGFDDALFTGRGRVCEGPTWNVAVVIGDELIWPDDDCLAGITRGLLQQILDGAGVAWSDRSVARAELAQARAAFITSAGIGVQPVAAIDGVRLDGDPALLKLMQDGYAELPGDRL